MVDLHTIGNLIRKRRKQFGYSQEKLAELAQVSRGFVRRLENADFYDIGFIRIMNVLEVLDLDFTISPKDSIETLEDIYLDVFPARKNEDSRRHKTYL